jgi:hypothetical protein
MATKAATVTLNRESIIVTWAALNAGDDGQPVDLSRSADRTAQVVGDATTVAIQGSPDGTNWSGGLKDINGTVIAMAGATKDAATIAQATKFIRPVATGGTSTVVTVIAYLS